MLSITNPSSSSGSFGANQTATNPESNSSSLPLDLQKKTKKKKRSREDNQGINSDAADGQERRKKSKRNSHVAGDSEGALQELSSKATSADPASTDNDAPLKHKKKKRDKGREPVLAAQTDAEIEANSQASAAALLSAIVAASVANPEGSHLPAQGNYDSQMASPHGHQFMRYPPMHFPFMPAPHFDPNAPQQPYPGHGINGGGGAFSELAFGSNEDVLRALQDLDITKIANVLKTLGEAAAAANVPPYAPQLSFMPSQLQTPAPPVGQLPATSSTILGIPPKQHTRTINMDLPGNEQHTNPDHAHILANKWLNASKLAELVRDEGLVYKKGKFSAIEEQQLRSAIERYQNEKQLSEQQLLESIFSKNDKSKDTAFWAELTAAVPLRPIIAVYHHVRRSYHPLKQQGAWKVHEDGLLKQAVADFGQQWEKVSFRVGRMASDCRDRYRNHILNRDIRVTGHWSKEEEEKLTRIVKDMTINQGKDIDNDVFWGKVSELMDGSRGRQQCRIKWTDALSKTVKNDGQKPRWSQQDAFILVHKVDSLQVRDDTEIDWKTIPDSDWNLWSAHTLQRRWLTLKKGVKGFESMTHQEIMDILRIKKAHLPAPIPPPVRKRKERKVTSAAAIHEKDAQDSVVNDATPEAGSSTGPGTLTRGSIVGNQVGEDGETTDSDEA